MSGGKDGKVEGAHVVCTWALDNWQPPFTLQHHRSFPRKNAHDVTIPTNQFISTTSLHVIAWPWLLPPYPFCHLRNSFLASSLLRNQTNPPGRNFLRPGIGIESTLFIYRPTFFFSSDAPLVRTEKMPTPGYVFRDGGATPPLEQNPNSEFRKRITQATKPVTATSQAPLGQNTSTSHQLATGEHDVLGAAQKAGKEDRITNLGWQANAVGVDTLVGGLPNDELWTLVRRFNKASSSHPHGTCGRLQ